MFVYDENATWKLPLLPLSCLTDGEVKWVPLRGEFLRV